MHTQNITPIRPAPRTPYHSLGEDATMRIPEWAQHRSVYRSAGRTLYVVETDALPEARHDLVRLDNAGWNVAVESVGSTARIALSRAA